jgi:hypothetical protein
LVRCAWLPLIPLVLDAHVCETCHPKEVAAYLHTEMGRSLRRPRSEPEGSFRTPAGTSFMIRSSARGVLQRMERFGGLAEYQVAYVLGSGNHAVSYLIQVRDHLFQSPVCYYSARGSYDLCPGYERAAEPDFTRPVGEECVLCHSGQPQHVPGTPNQYGQPVFLEDAISCERCHGPAQEHLKHPAPGSIVNPGKLAPAARDSICEQCHLVGVTQRILNPGKDFGDFHPGQRLEDVFTVYTRAGAQAFKVISHVEQLALSACGRGSQGKMWCGTCHDPHPQAAPTSQSYNHICQTCHEGKLAQSHPAATNCVGCHMARRPAQDGGHTVFTDHRIRKKPDDADERAPGTEELRAWRPSEPELQTRNLGLAYVNAGLADSSPAEIARGYRMLAEFQPSAPDDIEVLRGIGRALLAAGHPAEALKAFEWALKLAPDSVMSEEQLGVAFLKSGQLENAASHLERALQLDPLLLSAGTALQEVYRKQGNSDKAGSLAERMRRTMLGLSH